MIHDITIQRAELEAALMNASTGFVVSKSFGDLHKKSWKMTESQVVLQGRGGGGGVNKLKYLIFFPKIGVTPSLQFVL